MKPQDLHNILQGSDLGVIDLRNDVATSNPPPACIRIRACNENFDPTPRGTFSAGFDMRLYFSQGHSQQVQRTVLLIETYLFARIRFYRPCPL